MALRPNFSPPLTQPRNSPPEVLRKPVETRQPLILPEHKSLFVYSSNETTVPPNISVNSLESKIANLTIEPSEDSRKKSFKQHLAETTGGIVTVALPLYASLETNLVCMSHLESMHTRTAAVLAGFGGLAFLYSKGRNFYHNLYKKDENFSTSWGNFREFTYGGIFNALVAPILYSVPAILSGEQINTQVLSYTTMTATALGAITGSIIGPSMDIYRDLYGFKESKLLSEKIAKLPPRLKKLFATGLTAVSLALTSSIYRFTEDNIKYVQIERVENLNSEGNTKISQMIYSRQPAIICEYLEHKYGVDISTEGYIERLHEERRSRERRERTHSLSSK